jgi:metal-responsive CopG/Arc/MetJ family transcriptional regulator
LNARLLRPAGMCELSDMESVTLELDEETLAELDEIAFKQHRDNREAAIRDLLDEWLTEREE